MGSPVPRVTEYGAPPKFETVAEVDAALRAMDWYAQMLGYEILPAVCLQSVSHHLRNQLAVMIDSPVDASGLTRETEN